MNENENPASNLASILSEIEASAKSAMRDPSEINLVAVSKNHERERIEPVLASGHLIFGENRVQEAEGKWPALREIYPHVELHLIGPLQSNKAKVAASIFDVIETIDRPKVATALGRAFEQTGRSLPCYIQVNTGEEPQKAGVHPSDVDAFISSCRDDIGLDIRGLMCIPPIDEAPALHFALLTKLADRNGLSVRSMGMSADFKTAISLGATHVRVGTAIFGARPPVKSD